jgi:hypothetical protein
MKPEKLIEQIEGTLNPLLNMQLKNIGRAHTLTWVIFSPTGMEDQNKSEEERPEAVEYCFNIQCTWRIVGQEGIVVASDDLYFPAGDNPYRDLENFDWTIRGSNRLDERTELFLKRISGSAINVLSIETDTIGGLSIRLSEGYAIELFPANSIGREFWRFFDRNSATHHFVMTGKGIEESSE